MSRFLALLVLGTTLFCAGCDLSRPWQPFGVNEPPVDPTIQALKEREDAAIGEYNQIPDSLGENEKAQLRNFALAMPRGVQFRVWQDGKSPERVRRIGIRSLGVHSRTKAELWITAFAHVTKRPIKSWEIYRSARYTPASWDFDVTFSQHGVQGELVSEINRLHDLLANSALQGRCYLDSTNVQAGRIVARLRDRRVRTGLNEEAALEAKLRETYTGFDLKFTSRDVMGDTKVKQRVYDIEILGNFRGLETFVGGGAKLEWSPRGGPQHDPLPMDNDKNRFLIERENAKRREK